MLEIGIIMLARGYYNSREKPPATAILPSFPSFHCKQIACNNTSTRIRSLNVCKGKLLRWIAF